MLSEQLNDEQFVKAAKDTIRILIRRPHAYQFRKDYPGSPIPGLVLMDHKGEVLKSIRLPTRDGGKALEELFRD